MSLATIISYCTNDFRFIDKCIEEARKFSKQIVVAVCDHFFDGTPENRPLLHSTYAANPDALFAEFAYLPDRLYSPYHSIAPSDPDWAIYWAATTRYIGLLFLKPEIDWVLFLDADEIVEGDRFRQWFETAELFDAQRLAAYLYVLKPNLRAKKVVNLPLLVKKETLSPLTLLNPLERIGAYQSHPGPKREKVVGLHGKPLVHHYSWVRTKGECEQKAKTWGHREEAHWPHLIERAFAGDLHRPFDIPLEFEEISDPYFDPFSVAIKTSKEQNFPHVRKGSRKAILQMELELL